MSSTDNHADTEPLTSTPHLQGQDEISMEVSVSNATKYLISINISQDLIDIVLKMTETAHVVYFRDLFFDRSIKGDIPEKDLTDYAKHFLHSIATSVCALDQQALTSINSCHLVDVTKMINMSSDIMDILNECDNNNDLNSFLTNASEKIFFSPSPEAMQWG